MAKGKNIAYVRVSTTDQNEARQNEALDKYNIDKWYIEKITGKDTNRPKLIEMLDFIREDDTVYVEEFSRLGRSTQDLLDIVQHIENKGAKFISIKENFDTKTPAGRLQMTMMAAIAEFERSMILERQREGIAIAKKEGKYKGRKKIKRTDIDIHYDSVFSSLVLSLYCLFLSNFFHSSLNGLTGNFFSISLITLNFSVLSNL